LTPAETGLFWKGKLEDRDLYSMFLYWANKGMLDIQETSDQDFLLHRKTEELPTESKTFEKNMFGRIFDSGDQFSLRSSALQAGKAMHGAREDILSEFSGEQNSLYEKRSLNMRALAFVIAFLPIVFNTLFAISTAFWKFDASDFTPFIFLMCLVLLLSVGRKGDIQSGKTPESASVPEALKSPAAIISVSVVLASVFVIVTSGVLILHTPTHSIAAAASTAFCIIFAVRTQRKTEYYTLMLGQIRGFANFIKTAENDRLKMLIDENPNYYFDILPYAWAMELTNEWEQNMSRFGLKAMPASVVVTKPLSMKDVESAVARRKERK
jgi:hypothetical protein